MELLNVLDGYAPYDNILNNLDSTPISAAGIVESAQSHLIYSLVGKTGSKSLVITYSDMEARAIHADMLFYTDKAVYFPAKEYIFYNIEASGHRNENMRLSAIDRLVNDDNTIVVTSLDAVLQYTIPKAVFKENSLVFEDGGVFDIDDLKRRLVMMGYSREDMVEGEGQFSVRGGILDVFSPNSENPVRIEFFDDEVDSVREFDSYTQRSLGRVKKAVIIPVREAMLDDEKKACIIETLIKRVKSAKRKKEDTEHFIEVTESDIESFRERTYFPSIDKYISMIYEEIPSIIDYFSGNDLVFVIDPKRICERGKSFEWEKGEIVTELKDKGVIGSEKAQFYYSYQRLLQEMNRKRLITLDALSHTKNDFKYKRLETFTTKTTVSFHGKIDYLYDDLRKWQERKFTSLILVSTRGRGENLAGVLNDRGINASLKYDGGTLREGRVNILRGSLNKGFEYPELRFVVVSDREIFETKKRREKRKIENADRIKSYNDISPGDYVVHSAHGIGQYVGTEKMKVNDVLKDYLKIQYYGTDVLYIPIDQLNLLYKYTGGEDKRPKLNRLSGGEWNRTKQRVKQATDDLAKELIRLYAQRSEIPGYAFSPDTPWQREFEDNFEYTETEDQLRSIEEVKEDMEKQRPMDRLLCGDVGFGKTEVALRAAFKAVNDSKQVAYLCPTTVLAMQQYETFLHRMENFPIKVEMLSRFRTAAQQRKIIKAIRTGEVDIIIGTHRILSKDLKFKDLGLLVVDEEQRFGVAHKERLKELKKNVDVLTMTATPIPRTLHMAMTSIRDMSVLTEPPENRYPVQTYVLEFNAQVLLDAIRNELSRGGQVFYLYNSVKGIYRKASWIKSQFPDKNVAVGHGQMKEDELESIMYDMVNGDTDILVCTTIIETGLDITNANTIIIENADKMGLAQLYQLRGRVGRSNRAAYAYLTYRPDSILSDEASKRLRAIKDYTEFGSGFKIAMRDLEIRGAGNILGAQQHGHMDSVGYDMYCRILKESIKEAEGLDEPKEISVAIDISVDAYLPDTYIANHNQRIDIYKKIAAIESEDDKFSIEDELVDRYGDIPPVVQNIIEVASLKITAKECGIYEILQREDNLILKFMPERISAQLIFWLDEKFPKRIKVNAGAEPSVRFRLKEENEKHIINFMNELLNLIRELENKEKGS